MKMDAGSIQLAAEANIECHPKAAGGGIEVEPLRLYKQRWIVLTVLCLINATNQMLWLSYAPVADVASIFFGEDNDSINYLSLVFLISLVLLGLPTIWLIDVKGLKFSLILGAWVNAAGAVLRAWSGLDAVPPDARFPIAMAGQIVASAAQGVPMFGITKLAAMWFPDGQRAIASSIASMSNPLGILLAYVIVPLIVTTPTDIKIMQLAVGCPALATAIVASAAVRTEKPPTPPSIGIVSRPQSFIAGVKQAFRNRQFWLIFFGLGAGFGVFTTIFTLLQQELCRSGYDSQFSGLCGVLMIVFGILGAIVIGIVVEKTKRFEELVKVLYAATCVCLMAYCIISRYAEENVLIALSISLIGFFGLALYPILLELAVEVTYPVAEATSCGLITVSGGLHGILFLVMTQVLSTPLSDSEARGTKCQAGASDFTYANMFLECIVSLMGIVTIICLRPTYHRLNAEAAARRQATMEMHARGAADRHRTALQSPQAEVTQLSIRGSGGSAYETMSERPKIENGVSKIENVVSDLAA